MTKIQTETQILVKKKKKKGIDFAKDQSFHMNTSQPYLGFKNHKIIAFLLNQILFLS